MSTGQSPKNHHPITRLDLEKILENNYSITRLDLEKILKNNYSTTDHSPEESLEESPEESPEDDYTHQESDHLVIKQIRETTPDQQSSPTPINYFQYQEQLTHQKFNKFLTDELTREQTGILYEYLYEHLYSTKLPSAEQMMDEFSDKPKPKNFTNFIRIVQAMFYYYNYIYLPLVNYAGEDKGQAGLTLSLIIPFTQYLFIMFPNHRIPINFLISVPVWLNLFSRNYYATGYIENLNPTPGSLSYIETHKAQPFTALSYAQYGLTLALAAQASSTIIDKCTTFKCHPAGMMACAYNNYQKESYFQAGLDGATAFLSIEKYRGLSHSLMFMALMNYNGYPKPHWYGAGLADVDHIMPLFLTIHLTEDWFSTFIAGTVMLLNQYLLYKPRKVFLGSKIPHVPPWVMGTSTATAMAMLTLAVQWNDMPTMEQFQNDISLMIRKTISLLGYLVFMDKDDSLYETKDSLIRWITKQYTGLGPSHRRYHGESKVQGNDDYMSLSNTKSSTEQLYGWFPWFTKNASNAKNSLIRWITSEYAPNSHYKYHGENKVRQSESDMP